jgi:ectoine hydroxylase-related dioxygenase (phytanoyl-CoA dioxygenase family)
MSRTLSQEELDQYNRDGYVVIHDAVPQSRLREVVAETERMYNVAYTITEGTAMLDVDPAHTPQHPRVRRIKSQHEHSEFFHAFAAEPLIMDLLEPLMPSGIRLHNSKINMKSAGVGESIEWHQDWAFYPHTNDDVLAVGADVARAVPLTGPAGTVTIHHARLLHGSAHNRSAHSRRFLLQAYAAVDAWPLTGLRGGLDAFNDLIVKGEPTLQPRVVSAPVRIPLPLRADVIVGSIYDNQSVLQNRYFDALEQEHEPERQAVSN